MIWPTGDLASFIVQAPEAKNRVGRNVVMHTCTQVDSFEGSGRKDRQQVGMQEAVQPSTDQEQPSYSCRGGEGTMSSQPRLVPTSCSAIDAKWGQLINYYSLGNPSIDFVGEVFDYLRLQILRLYVSFWHY